MSRRAIARAAKAPSGYAHRLRRSPKSRTARRLTLPHSLKDLHAHPGIRKLCSDWIAAATASGGIAIGQQSESFRLHQNGVRFHELDYDELRAACVGLTEVLLLPGLNTIIDLDHKLLWSWCGEVLMGRGAPYNHHVDREMAQLAALTLRCALSGTIARTREAFDQSADARRLLDGNSKEFLGKAHEALPYVAFPFLESVARRACGVFVDLRGSVLQPFQRRSGSMYSTGQRCSNVGDLLALLVTQVAPAALQSDLTDVLSHIASLVPGQQGQPSLDGYEVVFDWRNSSLHGETSLTTIGGTILSLALLVALDGVRNDYSQLQASALARAQREVSTAAAMKRWEPSPWSYYPPFP